jgi:integrase/recombinase XerD
MLSDSEGGQIMNETFKNYLKAQGYSVATVKDYLRKQDIFLSWTGKEKLYLHQIEYKHLLDLIRYCRSLGHSRRTTNTILRVVNLYYKYRIEYGEILENPAIGLHIKGTVRRLPHDLLEWEMLENIHREYETDNAKTKRNKAILGLLIFQAITIEELEKLELKHLKPREGKVEVPGGPRSNRRILPLEAVQILDLQEYIEKTRAGLLLEKKQYSRWDQPVSEDQLFFGTAGDKKMGNTVKKLIDGLREKYPEHGKITATKIRESVIVHWLKSRDIRTVQYMAGHKYVSSTERYRELDMEHLKEQIDRFHPLQPK